MCCSRNAAVTGWVVDKRGGYKDESGRSTVIALQCCVIFGTCALVAAIGTIFANDFAAAIAALWLVLFFGGYVLSVRDASRVFLGAVRELSVCFWPLATRCVCCRCLLPPATGITIAAVPQRLRSFSSAWSMMAYNLMGYAAAPFICGLLADVRYRQVSSPHWSSL